MLRTPLLLLSLLELCCLAMEVDRPMRAEHAIVCLVAIALITKGECETRKARIELLQQSKRDN